VYKKKQPRKTSDRKRESATRAWGMECGSRMKNGPGNKQEKVRDDWYGGRKGLREQVLEKGEIREGGGGEPRSKSEGERKRGKDNIRVVVSRVSG